MTAITPMDVPRAFWSAYVSVVPEVSPIALGFDPASLGVEVAATNESPVCDEGTTSEATSIARSGCPSPGLSIAIDVDGVVAHFAISQRSDGSFVLGATGSDLDDLLIDGFGHGGVLAVLDGFTELDAVLGPRRFYGLGGLPGWRRDPADMFIAVQHVEEFVAQSDGYPISP